MPLKNRLQTEMQEKMVNIPAYESDTTFAFIDILGFKRILSEKPLPEILEIVNSILHFDNSREYNNMLPTLKTKLISDSFVVYAQLKEPRHATAFYVYLSTIIANIHRLGRVVTRGYISNGNHYNNNEIWISPAFVEAYLGESNKSIHPRVIIGETAKKQIDKIYPEFINSGFFKRDSDGYWFINYMTCISKAYSPNGNSIIAEMNSKGLEESLRAHKETILNGLNNEKDHLNKYLWIANYHNSFINENIRLKNNADFLIEIKNY
jgi:hypothetical protein